MTAPQWTDEELAVLREAYPRLGPAGMVRAGLLPGKSYGQIKVQAGMLGLRCDQSTAQRRRYQDQGVVGSREDGPTPEKIARWCARIPGEWARGGTNRGCDGRHVRVHREWRRTG